MASLLQHVGRGEVDGDALGRQRQPQRMQRGAHPLPAFAHRLVGQADDGEGDDSPGHLDLDVDPQHLNALERHRVDARNHQFTPEETPVRAECTRL